MQLAVLLGLAALWIAVLLPDFLRRRDTSRKGDSISNFSRHLSVLERSNPVTTPRSTRRGGIRRPASNVIPFSPRRETAPAPVATYRPAATALTVEQAPVTRRPVAGPAPTPRPHAGAAAPSSAPTTRSEAQRRRQDVIVALGAAALLSFLATLAFGGAVLLLHLAIDVAFLAYLALVLRVTRRASQRSNVSYLARPTPSVATAPATARRTVAR